MQKHTPQPSNVAISSIDQNNSSSTHSGSSKPIGELLWLISQRNEAVYHRADENTTLCGIPEASKDFYFMPGENPTSTFLFNGWKYLTVYVFVQTSFDKRDGGASC